MRKAKREPETMLLNRVIDRLADRGKEKKRDKGRDRVAEIVRKGYRQEERV